ncbi:MAG: hypothetical protein ACOCYP_02285 [Planctomycetota bacterium]
MKITPQHFAVLPHEKTGLNWFLFELALEYQSTIPKGLRRIMEEKYTSKQVDMFCIAFAKSNVPAMMAKLEGRAEIMQTDYRQIERILPKLSDEVVNRLMDVAATAWDKLLACCEFCPSACLTNRDKPCAMFDDPHYY